MIDHVMIKVKDLAKSKAFYQVALKPLGYSVKMEFDGAVGFGATDGMPDFFLGEGAVQGPAHIAFTCAQRVTVDAFHTAALKAGGRDNGEPGLRSHYHPTYYGAFIVDPDGHNVEAVCHR
jgi:catechol 2,3-dioxygenase-like lactoylglutathione lyase family enzyme